MYKTEFLFLWTYLQCVGELGGVYGGMGFVRVLALSRVGTPGLFEHSLSECPPVLTMRLQLHQGGQSQACREAVRLCTGVTDKPERKQTHSHNKSSWHRTNGDFGNVTSLVNPS